MNAGHGMLRIKENLDVVELLGHLGQLRPIVADGL
jgi:hypothetical protein